MASADDVKKGLLHKRPPASAIPNADLLSTGATVANLGLSGRLKGGFVRGTYNLLVGDSGALKTWLCLSVFAEASINPLFKGYRFIYDGKERGAKMDIARFFGQAVGDKIEPPRKDKDGLPVYSNYVQDMYFHLEEAFNVGKPFIYVVDSENTLRTPNQDEHFKEMKSYIRGTRQKEPGTYGTDKPKFHSENLGWVIDELAKSQSMLFIIAQTRQNIGFGSQYNPKTRSGGDALTFFADSEIWTSVREHLTRKVRGIDREIGTKVRLQIKKNRISGRMRKVEVLHYPEVGIDDTGSMVNYLCNEKVFSRNEQTDKITAPQFDFESGDIEELVRKIENDGAIKELKMMVQETWDDVESKLHVERKPRYGQEEE